MLVSFFLNTIFTFNFDRERLLTMNNRFAKILLPLIIIALVGFLIGIPYVDNSEIDKKISLLKSKQNKKTVSSKFNSKDFINLPLNVKKYLRKAIKNKSNNPVVTHITLVGKTRPTPKAEWMDYNSKIYYSTTSPNYIEVSYVSKYNYLWDKTTNIYTNEKATTETKFLSIMKTNEFSGNKLNTSYLVKYLMLAFTSPTTLLPSKNVHWKKTSGFSSRVIIWDEHLKGDAVFYFNKRDEITKIVSNNRYMPGKIDYSKKQFTIHLANYKNIGSYYIPTYFEFQWNLPEGDFTFGRFLISDINYE